MIKRLIWTIWTLMSSVLKKADKLNLSLSLYRISAGSRHLITLQWHNNEHDGICNHQCIDCLLNRLIRCRLKETSKLCVTGLCERNSLVTGDFPAQRPVMRKRKMFPFDDVIMWMISFCKGQVMIAMKRMLGKLWFLDHNSSSDAVIHIIDM